MRVAHLQPRLRRSRSSVRQEYKVDKRFSEINRRRAHLVASRTLVTMRECLVPRPSTAPTDPCAAGDTPYVAIVQVGEL